jgi:hypothetical protein
MTVSPKELARDAETSRARLDLTIDRLEQRLTPLGLADEAVGLMRRSASLPAVDRSLAAARRNPLPVLLIAAGAGLFAWRMWSDRESGPERVGMNGRRANGAGEPETTHPADGRRLPVDGVPETNTETYEGDLR